MFDTDVDRSGVVDESGFAINSNRMIALMSAITLREHPGSTIVTDSVTSNGLADFIESRGGKHFRWVPSITSPTHPAPAEQLHRPGCFHFLDPGSEWTLSGWLVKGAELEGPLVAHPKM